MATPAVFPAPPPTANALSPAQRAHLVRTTSKLSRVLGHTPQVHDLRPWAELHIVKDNEADNNELVDRRRRRPAVAIATLPLSRSRMQARTRPRIPSFDASEDLPPYSSDAPSTPPRSRSLRVHIPPLPATPELSPDDASDATSLSSIASAWLSDSPASTASSSAPVSGFCVPSSSSPPAKASSKPKKPSPLSPPSKARGLIGRPLIARPASPPVLRLAPSFPSPSKNAGPTRPFLAPGRAARLARLSAAAVPSRSDSTHEEEENSPIVPGVQTPSFAIPSEGAMRRAKMDRLRKILGECVPVGLVFPNSSVEDTTLPAHFDEDEEEEDDEELTPISMESESRAFTPAYFDIDDYDDEGLDSESVSISISSECDDTQEIDAGNNDADSLRAVRSPVHTPTRPLSPLSDTETVESADVDMTSSIEVFEAQLAAADAQLAKVRVPFVWRRKLDVILEHE